MYRVLLKYLERGPLTEEVSWLPVITLISETLETEDVSSVVNEG